MVGDDVECRFHVDMLLECGGGDVSAFGPEQSHWQSVQPAGRSLCVFEAFENAAATFLGVQPVTQA